MGSGAGTGAWVLGALPFVVLGYLVLIAGYWSRYHTASADGQRLFFMCAAAGLVLAGVALPLSRGFDVPIIVLVLGAAYGTQADYVRVLLTAALVGAVFTSVANAIDAWSRRRARGVDGVEDGAWPRVFRLMALRQGSPLQRLLIRAEQEELLVAITLSSRKVYCGHVLKLPPSFRSDDQYVEVIPMFSAARNKDTLKFEGRLDYPVFDWWRATRRRDLLVALRDSLDAMTSDPARRRVIDAQIANELDTVSARIKRIEDQYPEGAMSRISIRDWAKVIPFKLIESASIYDEAAYKLWFTPGDSAAMSTGSPNPDQAATDPA